MKNNNKKETSIRFIIITIIVILILGIFSGWSQSKISFSIQQDAKLALKGAYEDSNKGTLDLLLRLNMQGKQDKWGYFIVFPEFEYAEIKYNYKRYSANVGYTFNKLFIKNTEASFNVGWGFIDRGGRNSFSWSSSASAAYLFNKIKLLLTLQAVERTDLKIIYGTSNTIKISGFLGIEIPINL
jgi:hypothetical protein